MTKPTTAILLAAGRARRLERLTDDRPKCLLDVGGVPLIDHQLATMRSVGVEEIVVVNGYYAEMIESSCGPDLSYVHNEIYDKTNSLYSLSLALEQGYGANGFILTNADVLFAPELLRRLVSSPHPDALLFEPSTDLGDEEMKVTVEGGRVRAMAKTLPRGSYHGENLGVLKFSAAGAARLRPVIREMMDAGDVNAWAPKAFDAICGDFPIHAVSTLSLPWIEIDFPADIDRARRVVWPKIAQQVNASQPARGEAAEG